MFKLTVPVSSALTEPIRASMTWPTAPSQLAIGMPRDANGRGMLKAYARSRAVRWPRGSVKPALQREVADWLTSAGAAGRRSGNRVNIAIGPIVDYALEASGGIAGVASSAPVHQAA